jgi:3-phenylpropionate/trans-cinnamate dioxygenase ferredoxin subunit
VEADGIGIVLANVEGDLYALLDRCTHQDYPLSDGELDGTRLECMYHGAKFDVCTGRAMQLPAIRPVKTFEVEVREGDVYVQVGD